MAGLALMLSEEEFEARVAAGVAKALEPLRRQLEAMRSEQEEAPVTMREAARRLGVSLRTVERKVASGELEVVRTGRAVRVRLPPHDP